MIFLHSKQSNKDDPKYAVIKDIAQKKNAKIIGFNAPFVYKTGLMWFDKLDNASEEEILNQFNHSLEYLTDEINKFLAEYKQNWNDLILCGHSQGGSMAAWLGITNGAKEVIAIHSHFPTFLDKPDNLKKDTPIYWVEAENEVYFSEERKNSYKRLVNWGCNLKFLIEPDTVHDVVSKNILDLL